MSGPTVAHCTCSPRRHSTDDEQSRDSTNTKFIGRAFRAQHSLRRGRPRRSLGLARLRGSPNVAATMMACTASWPVWAFKPMAIAAAWCCRGSLPAANSMARPSARARNTSVGGMGRAEARHVAAGADVTEKFWAPDTPLSTSSVIRFSTAGG
jgi:hypothetical protein